MVWSSINQFTFTLKVPALFYKTPLPQSKTVSAHTAAPGITCWALKQPRGIAPTMPSFKSFPFPTKKSREITKFPQTKRGRKKEKKNIRWEKEQPLLVKLSFRGHKARLLTNRGCFGRCRGSALRTEGLEPKVVHRSLLPAAPAPRLSPLNVVLFHLSHCISHGAGKGS